MFQARLGGKRTAPYLVSSPEASVFQFGQANLRPSARRKITIDERAARLALASADSAALRMRANA